jgi:predicted Zn finger-like uncharacterized protein
MDVTCERCGTEYDFDETLVSERGTTVKCTNCGHLFKVFRPGAEGADAAGARPWAIRRRDGATETLATLRDLQRRITEGALSEEDLISRSGEGWKRLGDIAELETFFQAARAAAAPAAFPRRRDETASGFGTAKQPQHAPFARTPSSHPGPIDPRHDPRALAPTQEMEQVPPPPSRGSGARSLPEPPRAAPPARHMTAPGVGAAPPAPAHAGPPAAAERKRTMLGVGSDSVPPPPKVPRGVGPAFPTTPGYADATVPAAYAAATAPAAPAAGRAIPPTAQYPLEEVEKYRAEYAAQRASMAAQQAGSARQADAERTMPQGRAQARTLQESPPFAPSQARPTSSPPGRLRVEDDDLDVVLPKKSGPGRAVMIVALVVVVLGGGVALGWSKIGPALGLVAEADPAAAFLTRGNEALATDATAAYGAAITEYTKALAFRERDPRVLVALARAHAVWAQTLRFDAEDVSGRAATNPSAQGEAGRIREELRSHAAEALRFAEDAVRQSPADVDAELALSDAQRLSNDLPNARQHYNRAHELAPDLSAEGLRVGALLAADEAGGGLGAARELAAAAVAKDPALLRARLVLARALLASSDISGASTQIDAMLARSAGHERALGLRIAIRDGVFPAAPVVAVVAAVDAGAVGAPVPAVLPTGVLPPDGIPAAVAAGGDPTGGGAVPTGLDYDQYVERGNAALESGRVAQARQLFEAALRGRADGREALTGLGYVAMEQGDTTLAVSRFRGPASGGYGDAMIGMAEAFRAGGRTAEAIAAYRDYLTRFPSGPNAGMARGALDRLGASATPPGPTPPPTGGGTEPANPGGGGTDPSNPGGGGATTPPDPAPPTPPNELPAPAGATTPPPTSDTPAVGTE